MGLIRGSGDRTGNLELGKYQLGFQIMRRSWSYYEQPLSLATKANILEGYASSYTRLSVLGVPHINNLIECTGVLPLQVANYTAPDEKELEEWLHGERVPMS